MILNLEILKEYSKAQVNRIAGYIDNDPDKFNELMQLFFCIDYRVIQRSSAIIEKCVIKHPELIDPYLPQMVNNLKSTAHDPIKRNTLRILQLVDIPEALIGDLLEVCFGYLSSNKEAVAIKVFSMQVIYNITLTEPCLKNELRILIEDQLPYSSPGFISRGRKIMKGLEKLR